MAERYPFPFVRDRADPWMLRRDGRVLLVATDDNGGRSVESRHLLIRSADTIAGLATAEDHAILGIGPAGIAGGFWAPELHEIAGRLHLLVAPCVGEASWRAVHAHVLTLREGGDPLVAADWGAPHPVRRASGEPIGPAGRAGITLDMTVLEDARRWYAVWSQRVVEGAEVGPAELWIATIDPRDPARLTSEPSRILSPELAWERVGSPVLEGPAVLHRDGRVELFYSAAAVGPDYAVGVAVAASGADLLDPAAWHRRGTPVLASDPARRMWGPGHNGFVADEDGELLVVHHAMATPVLPGRHVALTPLADLLP